MKDIISVRPITVEPICPNPEEHKIVDRLKRLLAGQTDGFIFSGKLLKTEILGEEK